jgi:histidyl-tRNA synthetase
VDALICRYIYIIPLGTGKECLKMATELRKVGLRVDVDMTDRRLKKSMDYANKQGIPFVSVIGENEVQSGEFMLKAMETGREYRICNCGNGSYGIMDFTEKVRQICQRQLT